MHRAIFNPFTDTRHHHITVTLVHYVTAEGPGPMHMQFNTDHNEDCTTDCLLCSHYFCTQHALLYALPASCVELEGRNEAEASFRWAGGDKQV